MRDRFSFQEFAKMPAFRWFSVLAANAIALGVNPYDTFSCAIGRKGDVKPPCADSCKPLLRDLGVWAVEY
jgi:hypothetical protein